MASRGSNLDFSALLTSRGNPERSMTSQNGGEKSTVRFKPGGYPDDMFLDMTENQKHKYECNICFFIVKDPRQCTNSHLFCATCIFTWTLSSSGDNRDKCPVCRAPGRYRPDVKTESILKRKRVSCSDEKCTWTGSLLSLKKHYKNVHGASQCTTPGEPVLPPIIAPSINQGHVELDRSDDSHDMLWRFVQEPSDRHTQPNDMREVRNRSRLEYLFQAFSSQLEHRRRNIEEHYRIREAQRQDQWIEVDNLGRRLDEVSGDLDRLMSNMNRDSDRYRRYIQTSRNMEESLMTLSHSFPESAPVNRPEVVNPAGETDPCLTSDIRSVLTSPASQLNSIDDFNRNATLLTPPPLDDNAASPTIRPFLLSTLPVQVATNNFRQSPRRPPVDVGPAINTNLARSRASTRRLADSPRHSLGPSPRSLSQVNSSVTGRRLMDIPTRPAIGHSLHGNVSRSRNAPRQWRHQHDGSMTSR